VNTQLAVLLVYSAGLIGLGLWIGRRVESSGGFFVANRKLGAMLIFSTVLAANIGAGSTVGAASLGYQHGLSSWWWVGSAGLGTLVLAFWIGPRIWRMATQNGLYTVGDYLELRYGRAVRGTVTGLLWLGAPFVLAAQLIAMAKILEYVAGVPYWTGLLAGGLVMTIYFTAGGLLTAAWVNLIQLVVLLLGFAIAIPWAIVSAGGWEAVQTALPANSEYLDFWGDGKSGLIFLALLAPNFIVSPGLLQKVYGAIDERAVRLGLGAAGVALLIFAILPPLFGMLAHSFDPALADPDHALMVVLTLGLPTLLGGLTLAAVLSAEISSADAVLFMLATSLSQDLYKRFFRPDASDAQVLRVARIAAVAGGALSVLLALTLQDVVITLSVFYALMAVSLFVPVVAGLYTRRPGTPEALAASGVGIATLIFVRLSDFDGASWWLNPSLLGLIASAAAFGVILLVRRPASAG